ncbi:MAG TPA: hypothetical protein VK668_06200 [Mucilaginibacter sp.]|nr:hypothetical protein [Mucilaginibacter sp.]
MRLITIILCFFLGANLSQAFGADRAFLTDTIKHKKKNIHRLNSRELRAAEARHKDYFDDCVFINRYTIAQRLKKYPYSKAVKILAVSHPYLYDNFGIPDLTIDTGKNRIKPITKDTSGLIIYKDKLDYSNLIEVKQLTIKQINRLTNIVFNTDYKVHDYYSTSRGFGCFDPHNALIFLDKNGKVFDYLEICFECQNIESKTERITLGTSCNQKYELLRKYFVSLGIKYGTTIQEKPE